MTLQVVQVENIRQAALTRLRTTIDAAPPGDPLHGVKIPKRRRVKRLADEAPILHVVLRRDGGEGDGHATPYIDNVGVLHFNLLTIAGREEDDDPDTQAAEILEAIALLLLEDSTFLELFQWVESLRFDFYDVVDDDGEYDVTIAQMALEMVLAPVQFEPKAPDETDIATLGIATTEPETAQEIDLTE